MTDVGGVARDDEANAVAIQSNGKIVAAGYSNLGPNATSNDFALARYNDNGSLDSGFDGDGKVMTPISTNPGVFNSDIANAVVVQPDGMIAAAGVSDVDPTDQFALARYETDGDLDTTFDGDGKVIADLSPVGNTSVAHALAIQSDGKLVAAGRATNGTSMVFHSDFALARFETDGDLDPTFDGDGRFTIGVAADPFVDFADGVALQDDGKIVAAGCADTGTSAEDFDFAAIRLIDVVDAPTITDTDPDSPSPNNQPRVKGTAETGSTVRLYTSSDCTGTPVAQGTAARFASRGLGVTVTSDSSTTFKATATNPAGNTSACSTGLTYVEDSTPPAAPAITDTDPDSPANNRRPRVKGTVGAGEPTEVAIYKSTNCAESTKAVTGTVAQFTGTGITVTVPVSATTPLAARALDAAGNKSACSNAISYTELP